LDAETNAPRRARTLLATGAVVGLVAALGSISIRRSGDGLPHDAVATVNGTAIRLVDLDRAVDAVSSDRRDPLDASARRAVLDRLIEEELLVQRARELGLDAHDRSVRARLVTAMIESILTGVEPDPASADDLAAFGRHDPMPARMPRLWVRTVRVDHDRATAETAAARLRRGEDHDTVKRDLGVREAVAIPPNGLVPVATLREYLGPALTDAALALAPGEVSRPIADGSGFHVVQLVSREEGAPVRDLDAELRRRAEDRALRAYLDDLRAAAAIHVRE
jgi:hypothetical protein